MIFKDGKSLSEYRLKINKTLINTNTKTKKINGTPVKLYYIKDIETGVIEITKITKKYLYSNDRIEISIYPFNFILLTNEMESWQYYKLLLNITEKNIKKEQEKLKIGLKNLERCLEKNPEYLI